jgi:hypothetical protein
MSIASSGIGHVAEVDARDDLARRHVGEQLPQRLALDLGVKVPDGIDDGGHRQVNHALFGAEPAQLRVAGESSPEPAEICREILDSLADEMRAECLDRRHAHFVAAADRKRQAVPLERAVRPEDDVGG